jgi:modulator of FtsH protease HflK
LVAIVAFYAFTFRVDPEELGVVLQFGKPTRTEPPGLHFRLPYPIEEVRLPKVTRQNIMEIGMRSGVLPLRSAMRARTLATLLTSLDDRHPRQQNL